MMMIKLATAAAGALVLSGCATTMTDADGSMDGSSSASAQSSVTVGGAPMYANRTIVQNASTAPNLSTLVTAVQAAGLVDTLNGPGPFTVFAPTNDAFAAVPQATLNSLLQPENKAQLATVLTYHVVQGRIDAAELMRRIRAGGGTASVTTVQGNALRFSMMGDRVMIMGNNGSSAHVTTANVGQSNGMVHVIDGVLLP